MQIRIRITYRNGFLLNGQPAGISDIEPVFDERRTAALSVWEQYEQRKSELREMNLSPDEYQDACRQLAESLGI
ncbi:hypothetical protein LES60_06640 [Pectobacterium brasiliense]|uniref:hypothetical protein n=1 Tax=Pectobacterium brasiliense TaxID=180957 RepID=UPI001CE032C4|nr:hypothetical protein [Pectobacterium brasiliense]MCA5919285.1 hypothetical protein [Pectobacterium brasiliense]MCA5926328.1 hypothetical protein [Pectobacterium brasiliense]MCA5935656.1 hypothetical protein [Pectobacterium brasiliense]MCA5941587.1 hypothetical protein [Pectobacterium brasiliense]MCA5943269.1 hypothetical protein [Pectobacterium brasiliense]